MLERCLLNKHLLCFLVSHKAAIPDFCLNLPFVACTLPYSAAVLFPAWLRLGAFPAPFYSKRAILLIFLSRADFFIWYFMIVRLT
jgi:hypothetical protein